MNLQLTGNTEHGSPLLSLSAGSSTQFYWSPFGSGVARNGAATSLPGFNGERQDPLSGVTHLGNGYRAYSPALRRFTCPDSESPFGIGGINPYVYCDHDPINFSDPSGHAGRVGRRDASKVRSALKMKEDQGNALLSQTAQNSDSVKGGTNKAAASASGVSLDTHTVRQQPTPSQVAMGVEDTKDANALGGRSDEPVSDKPVTQIPQSKLPLKGGEKEEFDLIKELARDKAYGQKGNARNVAFMDFDIEGKKGTLVSVSGKAEIPFTVQLPPSEGFFFKYRILRHTREFDTERKLLEHFSLMYPDTSVRGTVSIHSRMPICASCEGVIKQFKRRYAHIHVHGFEGEGEGEDEHKQVIFPADR